MEYESPALDAVMLPQYQQSPAFMERFLVALHEEGADITRSENKSGIKLVDGTELEADSLGYFLENHESFKKEFREDLLVSIDEKSVESFCRVVSQDWYDGRRLRNNGDCQRLKRSVYEYLISSGGQVADRLVQSVEDLKGVVPLISGEDVGHILTVNSRMLYRHVEAWKDTHKNRDSISSADVFLRRGLALKSEIDTEQPYVEWDYINSYSLAFTAPEKFSQNVTGQGSVPAIINGDLALFESRVLFFSPFVPGMDIGQLEFGVIPSFKALPIHRQGSYGGIAEYIIDPAPYQK